MGWWQKLFGGRTAQEPFMEHPTGDFSSAIEAMEDAVRRLRKRPEPERWITFSVQGQGNGPEEYAFSEIRMRGDQIDVGERPLDVSAAIQAAGAGARSLVARDGTYSLAEASPGEAARLMDAIFRHHFNLRPFADEQDDYAVGAEW